MFTRYSDIEVPKNYSGNRFGRNRVEDTTTKKHVMQPQSTASSITLSPSFEEKISPADKLKSDTSPEISTNGADGKYIENEETVTDGAEADAGERKSITKSGDRKSVFRGARDPGENADEDKNASEGDDEVPKAENAQHVSPVLTEKEEKKHALNGNFANSGLSKIAEMLEKSSPEDLLLVMLIILLVSDTENKNDDIALTLALLLLSDKNKGTQNAE